MAEVFIVQNVSTNEIELKDFGILIPAAASFELADYDQAVISDEVALFLGTGDLIRLIDSIQAAPGKEFSFANPLFPDLVLESSLGFGITYDVSSSLFVVNASEFTTVEAFDASINQITQISTSEFATYNYVDGSIIRLENDNLVQDSSIENTNLRIDSNDASIVLLNSYNLLQDSSILALDGRIDIVDGSVVYLTNYNTIQDSSISYLDASKASYDYVNTEVAQKMNWRNQWSTFEYYLNDVVRDGDWTMVANKTTIDRPAPQADGSPFYSVIDSSFSTDSSTAAILSGHLYEFLEGGWVQSIRAYVPEVSPTTRYNFYLIDITDPSIPLVNTISDPILVENDWKTIALGSKIVAPGTKWLLLMDSINSGSTSSFTGGWTYEGDTNSAPGSQAWNQRKTDVVRVNKTDLDSDDRTNELLSATGGSIIRCVQTDDSNKYFSFEVYAGPFEDTTFVEYNVALIDTGPGGGPDESAITTIQFDVPIPDTTKYVHEDNYWLGFDSSYYKIEGRLEKSGVIDFDVSLNAYGVDIEFQPAYVSPDWDLLATSQIGGAGDGGEVQPVTFAYVDGSLAVRDASIAELRNYDAIQDASIILLETSAGILSHQNVAQDASIVDLRGRIDIIDGSIVYLNNYNVIQDASISALDSYVLDLSNNKVNRAGDTMTGGLKITAGGLDVTTDVSVTGKITILPSTNADPSLGQLWVDPTYGHLFFWHNIEMEDASSYDLVDRLTRSADDWINFPDTSSLGDADRILIEDAEDGYNKKWISKSVFATEVTGGFGQSAAYGDSLDESSTTSQTYINKLSFTTDPSAVAAIYRVGWAIWVTNSNNSKYTDYRVTLDASILDENTVQFPSGGVYLCYSGFQYTNLAAGEHTIEVDYRAVTNTAFIKQVRVEFYRASSA